MRRLLQFVLLLCPLVAYAAGTCPASVPSGITGCYFADFVSGSDTANGTTESTPWQHFPGMVGCASTCAGITPMAGQGFILRGGITWTAAALGWNWTWSGSGTTSSPGCTGSGCIYIGVDPLWFTGASWERPILNAGGAAITGGSIGNLLMRCYCNDVVVDNLEFTGLYWTGIPTFGTGANLALGGGSPGIGTNNTLEHLYIHGWAHNTSGSGTSENPCGIVGDTGDPNNNANTILEYSVISGADTAQDSCSLIFGSPPLIAYNWLEYGSSGMIIDAPVSVHDNVVTNIVHSFDSGAHENGVEENFSQTTVFYNNIIRHLGTGALGLWLAPDTGYTAYAADNIIYDTDTTNVLDFAASIKTSPSGTIIFWNNTTECGPDSNPNVQCIGQDPALTAVTVQNDHFITSAGAYIGCTTSGCVTPTTIANLKQSKATANGQGYTASQTYAFSPTLVTNSTVGAGTSAASFYSASGIPAQSTTYGVNYNATTHTVSTPALTAVNWNATPDAGAYQYPLGSTTTTTSATGVQISGVQVQ